MHMIQQKLKQNLHNSLIPNISCTVCMYFCQDVMILVSHCSLFQTITPVTFRQNFVHTFSRCAINTILVVNLYSLLCMMLNVFINKRAIKLLD